MLQLFKLVNSSSLRGSVEGCHGRLCVYPACLIYSIGCCVHGMDLAMHGSGEFSGVFVVLGIAACIKLR